MTRNWQHSQQWQGPERRQSLGPYSGPERRGKDAQADTLQDPPTEQDADVRREPRPPVDASDTH